MKMMKFNFTCDQYDPNMIFNKGDINHPVIDHLVLGTREFSSMLTARHWLILYHPDLYFGATITCEDTGEIFCAGLDTFKDASNPPLYALIKEEKRLSEMYYEH